MGVLMTFKHRSSLFYTKLLLMNQIKLKNRWILTIRNNIFVGNCCSIYNSLLKSPPIKRLNIAKSFYQAASYDECVYPEQAHIPVLKTEVLEALAVKEHGVYLDMTFGAGGHTRAILEKSSNIIVYGLDRDPDTKKFADELEKTFPNRFYYLQGKFSDLPQLLGDHGVKSNFFNGVLMDLGASSMQFDTPHRGFMLSQDGPLDMRMSGESEDTPTASQILAHIDEDSLYMVLKYYGQEKNGRAIARAIMEARHLFQNFKTTKELAQLIETVIGVGHGLDKLGRFSHPATKTFQALRILVNDELNQLDYGIRLAHYYLQPSGILAGISFHSLEDTILKRHFTGCDLDETPSSIGKGLWKHRKSHLCSYTEEELADKVLKPWAPLTKHVIIPSVEELEINPRSRSAKLRVASKIYCPPY